MSDIYFKMTNKDQSFLDKMVIMKNEDAVIK